MQLVRKLMIAGGILISLSLLGIFIWGVVDPTPDGESYSSEKLAFTCSMGLVCVMGIAVCCAGCWSAGEEYKDEPVGTRVSNSERDRQSYMREPNVLGVANGESAV